MKSNNISFIIRSSSIFSMAPHLAQATAATFRQVSNNSNTAQNRSKLPVLPSQVQFTLKRQPQPFEQPPTIIPILSFRQSHPHHKPLLLLLPVRRPQPLLPPLRRPPTIEAGAAGAVEGAEPPKGDPQLLQYQLVVNQTLSQNQMKKKAAEEAEGAVAGAGPPKLQGSQPSSVRTPLSWPRPSLLPPTFPHRSNPLRSNSPPSISLTR